MTATVTYGELAKTYQQLVDGGLNSAEASRLVDFELCAEVARYKKARRGDMSPLRVEEIMVELEKLYN